jgi:glycosyltransferase involved in cell wall biosynthesis
MKILINDFGGYAFPMQLSKKLAVSGLEIAHCFALNLQTPHGDMNTDIENLLIHPIILKNGFNKYSFLKRKKNEVEYANAVINLAKKFRPNILISANTPLFAQDKIQKYCRKENIKFIYWCQDIHSIAIKSLLKKKLGILGLPMIDFFTRKEKKQLYNSDYIISIADDFSDIFKSWGINTDKISTINNWAPLDEIFVSDKNNDWAKEMGFMDKKVILYSGTLGLKHNPYLLSYVAQKFSEYKDVIVIVVSEGIGAELLKKEKETFSINNLHILPYQPYKLLSSILGTADVLVSILEPEAGVFSVPSKVLTYLSAGKPILLSIPLSNLSVKLVQRAKAGFAVESNDYSSFYEKLKELILNLDLCKEMGQNGRNFAEKEFNIDVIAQKFIHIFDNLTKKN